MMKSGDTNMTTSTESASKVLMDETIPIENLLGSVTTYNNVEGAESLQVRTSARVFKKMKLDSSQSPSTHDKKESDKKDDLKQEGKRFRRPLWSGQEKKLFFQALNEYGKDFESIHLYVVTKSKKKGLPDVRIKTRDQIRNFYYRTWHKISKYLKFSNDVKKIAQELYTLINYGELRKKLSSVSEKSCLKLHELIYRGTVSIRFKGKQFRIRTPMCKALIKLNQQDEKSEDIRLPNRILVELRPKNMATWMRVQELSQNPRIRTIVPLQKRISCLMSYLSERWKSQDISEHEKLLELSERIGDDEPVVKRYDPLLRLCPPTDTSIAVPSINFSEFASTQSICLREYEKRIGVKISGEQLLQETSPSLRQIIKPPMKKGFKRTRSDSSCDKSPASKACGSQQIDGNESPSSKVCGLQLFDGKESLASKVDGNENNLNDAEDKMDDYTDEAVNTILSLNKERGSEEEEIDANEKLLDDDISGEEILGQIKREHDIAKMKLGWTMTDCGTLTIGDLYIMFGANSKVALEYSWDEEKSTLKTEETECKSEINENNLIENDNCVDLAKPANDDSASITFALRRLLSLAKLYYRKKRPLCPCGHVCGTTNKNNLPPSFVINDAKTMEVQNISSTIISIQQNNSMSTASLVQMPLIQPKIKQFSPSTLFRHPALPSDTLRAQLDSIQRLKPKYCNRRGRRPRMKSIVERPLPLLPNPNTPGTSRQIIQMNLITQEISTPVPIAPKIVPQINLPTSNGSVTNYVEATLTPLSVAATNGTFNAISAEQPQQRQQQQQSNTIPGDMLDDNNATTPSRVGSPTSISHLLEMALNDQCNNGPTNGKSTTTGATTFQGLLSDDIPNVSTPPTSPSRILKENDKEWLNSEVGDFSFSSFLGHLESPIKPPTVPPLNNEDSRLSLPQEVDAQLHSIFNDTSLDLQAKFADIAAIETTDTGK